MPLRKNGVAFFCAFDSRFTGTIKFFFSFFFNTLLYNFMETHPLGIKAR